MTRRDAERFVDILDAIRAIRSHLQRGDLNDGLVYDAVRVRLIEIGEAVKGIPAEAVTRRPARLGEILRPCVPGGTGTSTPCIRSCRTPSKTTFLRSSRLCFASRPRRVPTRLRDLVGPPWAAKVRSPAEFAGQPRGTRGNCMTVGEQD